MDESKIEFSGVQMGVPTGAEFTSFSSEIDFDRDDLAAGAVKVVIDLDSVTASYPVLAQVLRQEPWFNVAEFPRATFEATDVSALGEDSFEARGTLTLRGVTQPSSLTFSFLTYGPNPDKAGWAKAVMNGETTLQRTAFEVGQGEWGATDIVADEVTIKVHFSAERPIAP